MEHTTGNNVFSNVKVGDRFRDLHTGNVIKVTELTEKGFKYECTPYHALPARYGPSLVKSGEIFNKINPQVSWDHMYERIK